MHSPNTTPHLDHALVAQAAGFQNEKSFIRAFKGWTGHSPADFRRQATPLA